MLRRNDVECEGCTAKKRLREGWERCLEGRNFFGWTAAIWARAGRGQGPVLFAGARAKDQLEVSMSPSGEVESGDGGRKAMKENSSAGDGIRELRTEDGRRDWKAIDLGRWRWRSGRVAFAAWLAGLCCSLVQQVRWPSPRGESPPEQRKNGEKKQKKAASAERPVPHHLRRAGAVGGTQFPSSGAHHPPRSLPPA